jgi:hypothetical protein
MKKKKELIKGKLKVEGKIMMKKKLYEMIKEE